ncbi:oxidoreductase [Saccharopolyspora sp. NFXS83]|uniref:oxidoreductase n=1 Tax=Saccharopolyspora sp. NFXS83 TaxID=2993560 RepID=UPI00224AE146|nr:oxidoreductase [Saccharopolyspora sp. NFXS83]MCX2729081.1 oxidoreductase [Saccharopolyspora sp. NFXS83]
MSVWFITGISRGLGRALAEAALGRGHTVVGTTRSGECDLAVADGRLRTVALDITVPEHAAAAVAAAHEFAGRIDVVVNNAGYGLLGAIEETSPSEAEHVFDVNFFGALRVVRAALPVLREQRCGHVVNISSIAALAPGGGSGLYAAAKAALGGMSEALAQEVAPLGIKVTAVEPGQFRTDFLSGRSRRNTATAIDDYAATSGSVTALEGKHGKQFGDPARAAEVILDAVADAEPPMHLVLGADALDRTRANADRLLGDLRRWEGASAATAFPS